MSDVVIRVQGLGKRYRLGTSTAGYQTLRESLALKFSLARRRARRPAGSGSRPGEEEFLWALKRISFEVREGEVLGIIGRNGAGKSTLLKILSRITEPTEGRAEIQGRVGSLLEVGTGFHPELTGRENIYLSGAILGMTRREIGSKFDEIAAFAEVERFLDTPVKRYSSGMYVKLAFAVAAHLEPEILLVDEVLAVGDAAFQKKCLGKMGDIATEGRTVLFVSHNMPAVRRLCPETIWLDQGHLRERGASETVIDHYLQGGAESSARWEQGPDRNRPMRLRLLEVRDQTGRPVDVVDTGHPFSLVVEYDINQRLTGVHVILFLFTQDGTNLLGTGDADCDVSRVTRPRMPGRYRGSVEIPAMLLGEGVYRITASVGIPFVEAYDRVQDAIVFEVRDYSSRRRAWLHQRRPGLLGLELPWTNELLA